MAASLVLLAKRALVSLLLALAQQHGVRVTVTRDSADSAVEAAFRAVVRKVHPDKGGRVADAQQLQNAREKWRSAKAKAAPGRRPQQKPHGLLPLSSSSKKSRPFLIRSSAVLLTYHGVLESAWPDFLAFVTEFSGLGRSSLVCYYGAMWFWQAPCSHYAAIPRRVRVEGGGWFLLWSSQAKCFNHRCLRRGSLSGPAAEIH